MRSLAIACAVLLATAPVIADADLGPVQAQYNAAVAQAKADMLSDPRAAATDGLKAEALARSLGGAKAQNAALATAFWLQAEASDRLDDVDQAKMFAERAFAAVRVGAPGSAIEASILLVRGSVAAKQARVADALRDYQSAHRLFQLHRDQRHTAIALISLAMLYVDAKDYDSALHYLDEALEAYPADAGLSYAIFNTRGLVLRERKDLTAADAAFRKAIEYTRVLHSRSMEAVYLRNLARNQLLSGQVAQAEMSIRLSARASPGGGEDAVQLATLSAQAALQRHRLAEAGRLIDKAFAGVDLANTDTRFRYAHETAVSTYRALGHPDKALAHLEAMKRLDDQATELATKTSTALMAARFDSANQEAKIARLRDAERLRISREALRQARAERTLLLVVAGATAAIAVLLAVGLFALRRSRDQVRATNDDLAITNDALGKALAAKTEFLATTSHEIRTPLNGILGMAQVMLADVGLSPAVRERIDVVHGAGLTMRALVDDILDVAKMETGNLGLEHAPFDPAACVRDATAMWAEQARAKGLAFHLDVDRCPPCVAGDSARVRQIVFNLLSNALKFTAQGSVSITAMGADDGLRLVVADTGVGIPVAQQEAVFESFRQADASTTRRFGGTGLGLSICRSLVHAMGGRITLASRPGEGTSFTVTLPLPTVDKPAEAEDNCIATLLIVDRNPITRAMFRTLFAPHVGAVAFAATVAEATARLSAGGIEQVLVDDGTARAGGDPHGFVAALVEVGVPVTLLWPVAATAEQGELMALGLARVITKPVTGAALVSALCPRARDEGDTRALVSEAA